MMPISMADLYLKTTKSQYPKACYQVVEQGSVLNPNVYKTLLFKYGMVVVDIKVDDRTGVLLEDIINAIGLPRVHNARNTIMWDIRSGGRCGHETLARSHKLDEFVFHTDCSYEQDFPGYFGLYVVEPDQNGGGKNLLVSSNTIIQNLSQPALSVLMDTDYTFKVPPEFYKGIDTIRAPIISHNMNLRYRLELIEQSDCTTAQINALNELTQIIANPDNLTRLSLGKNQLLLLDNKRFLHARTQIKDKNRHLKRIRFDLKNDSIEQ